MSVSILLVIWKCNRLYDCNSFEFKRSMSFTDLAQRSLGLNILKSETTRLVTITYSNLLITRTGINCQMSSKGLGSIRGYFGLNILGKLNTFV